MAHFAAPTRAPRVGSGVFHLVQRLVVAGEKNTTALGRRDVLHHHVVRRARVVERVQSQIPRAEIVRGRDTVGGAVAVAVSVERDAEQNNLHRRRHDEHSFHRGKKNAGFGLGEAHGDDGLFLAAVFDGDVVGDVETPEEEGVIDGGPRAADFREHPAEAHGLAGAVPLEDNRGELVRAHGGDLRGPLRGG